MVRKQAADGYKPSPGLPTQDTGALQCVSTHGAKFQSSYRPQLQSPYKDVKKKKMDFTPRWFLVADSLRVFSWGKGWGCVSKHKPSSGTRSCQGCGTWGGGLGTGAGPRAGPELGDVAVIFLASALPKNTGGGSSGRQGDFWLARGNSFWSLCRCVPCLP